MGAVIDITQQVEKGWLDVGALDDIPLLGSRVVRVPSGDIALFRTREGEVHALDDRCPHKGGPLSQGIVTGCQVICPLHDWCINLASGEAEAPDEGSTRRYPVRLLNGRVLLGLGNGEQACR